MSPLQSRLLRIRDSEVADRDFQKALGELVAAADEWADTRPPLDDFANAALYEKVLAWRRARARRLEVPAE